MPQQFFDINPLDRKFREELKNFGVQPRKRMWFRITHELDRKVKRDSVRNKMFLALGILSVTAIVLTAILIPETTQTYSDSKAKSEFSSVILSPVHATSPEEKKITNKDITVTPSVNQLEILNNNLKKVVGYLDNVLNQLNRREIVEINPIPKHKFAAIQTINTELQEIALKNELKQTENKSVASASLNSKNLKFDLPEGNSFCVKGFYAGVSTAVNYTMLNDKKAKANDNFHPFATFGTAYSLKAGYNFSDKFGVEAGWNIKSTQGQKYNFIPYSVARVDVDQMKNRITLNYTQFPVVAKYKFVKTGNVTKRPVALNVEAGAQYGYLQSADRTYQNELAKNDNFRSSELAAVAGIGYDVFISKNVAFSIGARATYGTNILQPVVSEYNEFAAPHNFVAGVHLGLNYSFTNCR